LFFYCVVDGDRAVANLGVVLEFLTGASQEPPLGFPKEIEISFFTPEEHVTRYPSVSTCFLTVALPRGYSDDVAFADYMDRAILESPGFGKI